MRSDTSTHQRNQNRQRKYFHHRNIYTYKIGEERERSSAPVNHLAIFLMTGREI